MIDPKTARIAFQSVPCSPEKESPPSQHFLFPKKNIEIRKEKSETFEQ